MDYQIALLRGINVGGRNKLKMVDLRTLLEQHGFKNVSTYIQSGNVFFENRRSNLSNATKIRKLIAAEFEYDVSVLVRDADNLTRVALGNPFGSNCIEHLHVTFLHAAPKNARVNAIANLDFGDDQFKVVHDAVYVYCPNGYARTKLNNNFFESKLGVDATTRNWKTLNKLIELTDASA